MKDNLFLIPDSDRREPLSLSVPKTLADRVRGPRADGSSVSAWAIGLFYEAILPELIDWTIDAISIRRYIDATLDLGSGPAAGFNVSMSMAIDEADAIIRRLQERIADIERRKTKMKQRLDEFHAEAVRRFEKAATAVDRLDAGEISIETARELVAESLGHGIRVVDTNIEPRTDDLERLRSYLHWVRSLPMPTPRSVANAPTAKGAAQENKQNDV